MRLYTSPSNINQRNTLLLNAIDKVETRKTYPQEITVAIIGVVVVEIVTADDVVVVMVLMHFNVVIDGPWQALDARLEKWLAEGWRDGENKRGTHD